MHLHHPAADRIFLRHLRGEVVHLTAFLELAERDLAGLRRFAVERRQFLFGPFAAIGFERSKNLFIAVAGEQAVDPVDMLHDRGGRRGDRQLAQYAADAIGVLRDARLRLGEFFGGQIVGGEAQCEAFGPVEPRAGEREIRADAPFQPRQIPAAADVGEQADPGFGHREARMFGRDAIFRRLRNADAAAHGDAVHEGDDGLRIGEEQMVEAIFGVEELPRLRPVLRAAFREHANVAAGAKAAAFAMVDDHCLDGIVIAPFEQRVDHRPAHRQVERVDRLRTIERQAAGAAVDRNQNIFGHWRSKSLPTIIRITWFVPSRIEWTRRSRQKRSIG